MNYKFAGSGGFAAHVDRAGYGAFSNLKHLSIAIAIDPANQKNGGMEVVSGSHKMKIPIGADKTLEKSWVEAQEWIPVNLEAGKTNFLNHRSKSKLTEFAQVISSSSEPLLLIGVDPTTAPMIVEFSMLPTIVQSMATTTTRITLSVPRDIHPLTTESPASTISMVQRIMRMVHQCLLSKDWLSQQLQRRKTARRNLLTDVPMGKDEAWSMIMKTYDGIKGRYYGWWT